METNVNSQMIVGNEEWCALPKLSIPAIKARIDSGAHTSSLHAFNIQPFKRNGMPWVTFEIHPLQRNRSTIIRTEAEVFDRRVIKSSSGDTEKRYVIKTSLSLGAQTWEIELTLSNRDSMGFRMLLGREAMKNRILVDPSASCLHGNVEIEQLNTFYDQPTRITGGLRIGLLASNPKLYSNQRIMEAGEERGHTMQFINIKQCYMKLDHKDPEVHSRGGKILNQFDAIIPRIRPSITFYGCALVRQFENIGVYSLNSSTAIAQSRDKLFSLQLLLKNQLDIPTTGFANSPIDTDDLIEMVGGAPLIVKLLEGAQGKGVVLAETRKAAESVINAFKSLQANLLVQEFVKEANGKDIRCFVVNGKVVASIQRQAPPGEFRANVHLGGKATKVKITPEEKKLAIQSTRVFGLKVAGVDIIRSSKGPLLLEVNSSPGLEGIENATGKDVAGAMIVGVEKALNWKRELNTQIPC
jgi:ribosomal protein S6--L-glutamate ligase